VTQSLIAIAFAIVCTVIAARTADRPAGERTAGLLVTTVVVVAAEAFVGLSR
jgi:hypothetical protein